MTAKETAEAAPPKEDVASKATPPSEVINDLFHEAMLGYEKALKSGIKLQEDSLKCWNDMFAQAGSLDTVQNKMESLSAEVFPMARKGLEEGVETLSLSMMLANRTGSQALELLTKALAIYQATSVAEAQLRFRDLVDRSLDATQGDVQNILNTNTRIIRWWKDLADWNPFKNLCAVA